MTGRTHAPATIHGFDIGLMHFRAGSFFTAISRQAPPRSISLPFDSFLLGASGRAEYGHCCQPRPADAAASIPPSKMMLGRFATRQLE